MTDQRTTPSWAEVAQAADTSAAEREEADGPVRFAAGISERVHRSREKRAAKRSRAEAKSRLRGRKDGPKLRADEKLELQATVGNLTVDKTEVYAWFTVTPVSHGFQPVRDIESAITSEAVAYSVLQNRRIKIRSTTRPYSVSEWAKDTYDDAASTGTPAPAFGEYLMRSQEHMQRLNFSEKWVHLGVRLSTFRRYPHDPVREVAELRKPLREVTDALQGSSLDVEPCSREDMEWLLRRSVALGLRVPRIGAVADYTQDDVPELSAAATWTGEPLAGHITVTGTPPGESEEETALVSVLTLGRLSEQAIPQEQQTGWMQRADRVGFPVEWCATVDIVPEQQTRSWVRARLDVIADQVTHYRDEHGMDPPVSLLRHKDLATDIQTSLDSDHGGTAIRTVGWYRVAIAAPDESTLKARIKEVRSAYGSRADLVLTPNQYHCAREFIPGEKLSTGAHVRRMSVVALAAAIPQGTAEVGDRCGVTLGYTAGSAMRAVAWNTHWDMERRDRSGLLVLTGGLGAGKTFALGGIVYQDAMSGTQWHVLDPSDRLGRLCELPEFDALEEGKPRRARYVNLMKGRAGELNPYRVVADPVRAHYRTDAEYDLAVSDARGTRGSLMRDVLYSFLSPTAQSNPDMDTVLTRALSAVNPVPTSSATDVLNAIRDIAAGKTHKDLEQSQRIKAQDLVLTYERLTETPVGKLIFPPEGSEPLAADEADDEDMLLTVYTLNGMSIPSADVIASKEIPENARLSMSVMTLAAWLVQSKIYLGDRHRRKGLAIDEGKTITTIDAGKNLITKTATDSRKFNLRAILCSQNVTHFDMNDDSEDSLGNLIGAALIGATQDDAAVNAALKALRAPVGQGYEDILKGLRPPSRRRETVNRNADGDATSHVRKSEEQKRHFIFSDGRNIERIVFDLDAHPHVVEALDSTPHADASEG